MDASFFDELWMARSALASGLFCTIGVSAAAITAGSLLGLLIGVSLAEGPKPLKLACRIYVDVLRGTPVLVLVLAAFYLPAVFRLNLDALTSGILALTLFCGAHVGEIVRGALQSIPPGQIEAGRSIGLTYPKILVYVLLPQALRSILPTWINTGVELVKASTLLSVIGVGDFLLKVQEIIGRTFMSLDFYVLAGCFYLAVNFAVERLGKAVERRLAH
ncbi:ABC transporter permease [Aliidongia dinghuensis]|uniref:ABC transporter permease n=1 Tax=Aliidongia dinghuensis TaxID=1867774 RepID=A0A8J2Z0Z0_9PROT|nr:amino acid ABC transporter permease [Aliidongia dinghuensis]GGF46031.1 ABC transporter permease [Aliidongia dinghuensis]